MVISRAIAGNAEEVQTRQKQHWTVKEIQKYKEVNNICGKPEFQTKMQCIVNFITDFYIHFVHFGVIFT